MPTARNYSNTSSQASLTAAIGATDTSITLSSFTGYPAAPFTAALARGTATEEIVLVTAVSGSTITVTRGFDGTSAQAQGAGTTVQEVAVALDFREANAHTSATAGVHGVTGHVVGDTDTQTLSNKTLTAPTITSPTVTGPLTGQAISGTTGTFSGALTANGGVTVPAGQKATLADAPAAGTDAANKAYVDSKSTDTGWLACTLTAPWTGTCKARQVGAIVDVRVDVTGGSVGSSGSLITVATLPAGITKPTTTHVRAAGMSGSSPVPAYVLTSGAVGWSNSTGATQTAVVMSATYISG